MKLASKVLLVTILFASCLCQAKPKGNLVRGGYGFLFPDNNGFQNPGQFSRTEAFAFESYYTRHNLSQVQTLTPSMVYGNGKFGLGVFGARTSDNLASGKNASDTVGVGMGMALAKGRVTVGAEYTRVVSAGTTDKGDMIGSVTLNPAGTGLAIGMAASSTLNSGTKTQTGTFGVGYMVKNGWSLEADATINDFKNTNNVVGSAYVNYQAPKFFMGTGYSFFRTPSSHQVAVRLGAIVHPNIDLSIHAEKVLRRTNEPTYGASFRVIF